jgi:translation initiation factor 2 subunit 1
MYEKKYPDVDDLVMVNVKSIAEMGAYVSLLEYNNIEGMILLSELSRRRIRSVSKLIRVGRQEVVVVLRVDKEKGYIDLSKRRVAPEEIAKCEERYNKSKAVHSIMRHVSETTQRGLEELYIQFGWPLYHKFGHAYDAFKVAITDPDSVFKDINIEEDIKNCLVKNIQRRLTPQPVKVRADLEVTCFHYEGIDAIKAALKAGETCGTKDFPINIKLVAPPLYVMVGTYVEKDYGITHLTKAIELIQEELTKRKGELIVKVPPRSVSASDELELTNILERLERENKEVDGDDDISDEEGEEK